MAQLPCIATVWDEGSYTIRRDSTSWWCGWRAYVMMKLYATHLKAGQHISCGIISNKDMDQAGGFDCIIWYMMRPGS